MLDIVIKLLDMLGSLMPIISAIVGWFIARKQYKKKIEHDETVISSYQVLASSIQRMQEYYASDYRDDAIPLQVTATDRNSYTVTNLSSKPVTVLAITATTANGYVRELQKLPVRLLRNDTTSFMALDTAIQHVSTVIIEWEYDDHEHRANVFNL